MKRLAIALLLLPLAAPAEAANLDRQTLSPADLSRVQRQCAALRFREGGSLINNTEEPLDGIVGDPSSQWASHANAMDSALSRVDLDRLSLEDCRREGFYNQAR